MASDLTLNSLSAQGLFDQIQPACFWNINFSYDISTVGNFDFSVHLRFVNKACKMRFIKAEY